MRLYHFGAGLSPDKCDTGKHARSQSLLRSALYFRVRRFARKTSLFFRYALNVMNHLVTVPRRFWTHRKCGPQSGPTNQAFLLTSCPAARTIAWPAKFLF